jgi:hypothetical protein
MVLQSMVTGNPGVGGGALAQVVHSTPQATINFIFPLLSDVTQC